MWRVIWCFFLPGILNAQLSDDFTDGDLSVNPRWRMSDQAFINVNGYLQSNHPVINSSFYISAPFQGMPDASYRLTYKLSFNTSSVNYVDYFIESDSFNLLNAGNGLFIRAGGSSDEISLFALNNGAETKILDGADGVLNHSSNQFKLELDILGDSIVLRHLNLRDSVLSQNSCKYQSRRDARYVGLRIRQSTASFVGKHYFDNLYAGPLIRDSIPPEVDSCYYSGPGLVTLLLSEPLAKQDISPRYFQLPSSRCNPDSIKMADNARQLDLYFSCLKDNQLYSLCMDSLMDLNANRMKSQCLNFFSLKTTDAAFQDLVINEVMADPEPVKGLPNLEYVEIYNRSSKYIRLTDLRLCDPSACRALESRVLFPDSFYVLYDPPSLNNSEDRISILDKNSHLIHTVHYTSDWYKDKQKSDGGYSLEMIDPYNLCQYRNNWAASMDNKGGTPGRMNSVRMDLPKDTLAPEVDRYEARTPDQLLLYFSERFDSIAGTRFPVSYKSQTIDAKILGQDEDSGFLKLQMPFIPDTKVNYRFGIRGPKDCDGNQRDSILLDVRWPAMALRNDLVINEVLFNPKTGGKDFIELYNRSDKYLDLSAIYMVDETGNQIKKMFQMTGQYVFLRPGYFLLLSEDTAVVCRDYKCPDSLVLKIQMREMPDMPDDGVSFYLVNSNFETIDSLVCTEDWHFKLISDKNGVSLERIDPDNFQMTSENWRSASYVTGYASPGAPNSQLLKFPMNNDYFSILTNVVSPDDDAIEDYLLIHYLLPSPDYLCSVRIFNLAGELVAEPYNNRSVGTSGQLTWDCLDLNGQMISEGHYLMIVQCYNPDMKLITSHFSLYVTHSKRKRNRK